MGIFTAVLLGASLVGFVNDARVVSIRKQVQSIDKAKESVRREIWQTDGGILAHYAEYGKSKMLYTDHDLGDVQTRKEYYLDSQGEVIFAYQKIAQPRFDSVSGRRLGYDISERRCYWDQGQLIYTIDKSSQAPADIDNAPQSAQSDCLDMQTGNALPDGASLRTDFHNQLVTEESLDADPDLESALTATEKLAQQTFARLEKKPTEIRQRQGEGGSDETYRILLNKSNLIAVVVRGQYEDSDWRDEYLYNNQGQLQYFHKILDGTYLCSPPNPGCIVSRQGWHELKVYYGADGIVATLSREYEPVPMGEVGFSPQALPFVRNVGGAEYRPDAQELHEQLQRALSAAIIVDR